MFAPVPAMRTIPISVVLATGETDADDEELFKRWEQQHQKLSSLSNLHRSQKEVDVRAERHLRFELVKFKAQRRLPSLLAQQRMTLSRTL
ncbi:hypothetical protein Plhal304r1_c002g0005501 [Plasmopara halstedii]